MTESICYPDDDLFRRHRNYLIYVSRKICPSVRNREILERFARIVLGIFIENKPEISKELSREDCFFLDETLCEVMSKELNCKKLLEVMAMWNKDDAAEFAANKCSTLFYNRHYISLKTSVLGITKRLGISDESEDIIQDVFSLVLYKKAGEFKSEPEDLEDFEELERQARVWLNGFARILVRRICVRKGKELSIEGLGRETDEGDAVATGEPSILNPVQVSKERKNAEKCAYESAQSPETASDWKEDNELCKKLAPKVFSGRELKIYLASIENYADDAQKNERMKKLDLELNIKPNTRSKSISRSGKKIWKSVEDAARKVLSGIELDIFLSLIKQYKYDNNKKEKDEKQTIEENQKDEKEPVKKEEKKGKAEREAIQQKEKREKILSELKDKYGKTTAEINKIYDDARGKVKDYVERVLQN